MSKKRRYLGGHTIINGGSELISHRKLETFYDGPSADDLELRRLERQAVVDEIDDRVKLKEKMETERMKSMISRFG